MADKRKILETARKLAQKGAKDKALAEYQKLLKIDPKDAKLRLEIGDVHRRWGQADQAIETYTRVAEQYMAEGFDARAVAVYKQILNLDPDRFAAYQPLAELYERMGLGAEAIAALQTAADGYHRQGRKSEALELLRKMASADPTNTRSRLKVADLLRQEGKREDAVTEYQLAAEELVRQGDLETVATVYRRILEIDDKNVRAFGALAEHLAARGKVAEAIPLAERALELDDGSDARYEQLASLLERAGRHDEHERILRAHAELFRQRGDEQRAREILQRFAPLSDFSSDEGESLDELAFGDAVPGVEPPGDPLGEADPDALFGDAFPESGGSGISVDFGSDIDIGPGASLSGVMTPLRDSLGSSQTGSHLAASTHAAAGGGRDAATTPASGGAAAIDADQLLAEASVYLRYGKRDKAIAHLERVIEANPEHRGALEKLGEAFAESGDHARAVETWLRAARAAVRDGDADALRVLRGRIAVLDEAAAATLAPPRRETPAPPPAATGGELDLDSDDFLLEDDDEAELATSAAPAARRAEPARRAPAPEREPDDEPLELGDDPLELDDAPVEHEMPSVKVAAASPREGSLSASTKKQVLDDLEEADFYMQQGLHEEARVLYQRILSIAPNHPRALLRLGEIEAARGPGASRGAARARDDADAPAPELDFAVDSESAEEAPGEAPNEGDGEDIEITIDLADDLTDSAEEEVDDPTPAQVTAPESEDFVDLDLDDEGADAADTAGESGGDTEELAPAALQAAAASGDAEGDFDLAAALADAFDDDPAASSGSAATPADDGFAAVFQAFKKGVREQLSDGDHQAHYDLAIAYKEMGLFDDAIHELRTAMADPGRTAECLHLIGLCALDSNQVALAIEHLEALLALPDLGEEAALAARFDLGRALEAGGDLAGARRAWEAVAARKPGFQDVRARLAGLGAPKPEPTDGGFESFDDVISAVDEDEPEPFAVAVGGETFDDLVAEANGPDSVPLDADDEPLDAEPLAEADPVDEAPERRPPPRPAPPPRRKKKISFF